MSTRRSGPTFGLVAKKVSNFEKTFNCLPLFAPDICFLSFSNLYFCLNFFTLFTTSRAVKPVQLNLPNLFKKFSNGERLLSVWTVYKHMHVIIPVSHIMYINIYYTYQNNIQLQVLSTSLLTFCSFASAFGSFYRPDSQLNSSWRNLAIPDHDFFVFFFIPTKIPSVSSIPPCWKQSPQQHAGSWESTKVARGNTHILQKNQFAHA